MIGLMRNTKIGIDSSVTQQMKAESLIHKYPEVTTVFSRIGTPESATDPMRVNLADTFVILNKDKKKWTHSTKDELFDDIRNELLKANPDQDVSATQPIEMRFNEILEGSRADVTLRIFGISLDSLIKAIDTAKDVLRQIQGVESVEFDPLTALKTSPILDISPIYSAQAKYGISLSELNHLVELSMSGKEIGSYFEQGRRYPIVIHLDEGLRENLRSIEKLPVGLDQGDRKTYFRNAYLLERTI